MERPSFSQHVLATARCLTTACLLLGGSPLWAQTPPPGGIAPAPRPERPYRGLFGGGVGDTSQSLTFEGSFGGGLVGNPYAELGSSAPTTADESTGSGAGNGSATVLYSLGRKRFTINVSSVTSLDYYPGLEQSLLPRYIVTGGLVYLPTASTNVTVSPGFKNLPEFTFADLFDPQEGLPLPFNHNPGMTLTRYKRVGLNVDVSQKLWRRSRIDLSFGYGHGMLAGSSWDTLRYQAIFTHSITKGLAVYGGYTYGQQTNFTADGGQAVDRHPNVNFGIDFSRPLSLTRRTTLSFSTGIARMQDRALNETRDELIGSAQIAREFGRTWIAKASVGRQVRFIETLATPILNDTVTFSLKGSFSQKMQFGASIGQSMGRIGGSEDNRFDEYFGLVQLSYALNRLLGLGVDYGYYRQSITQGALPAEFTGGLNQRSLRAYVQVWVPLLTQRRTGQ